MTGVYFVEGYGQTENCAAGCGTMFANYCFEDGAIGVPMPYTGIKLADVPDMGYHAAEGKGEICFRGHNVMKGMVKNILVRTCLLENLQWKVSRTSDLQV